MPHHSTDTITTLRRFKTPSGTTEESGRLVTKVDVSVPQSPPVSNGQANIEVALSRVSTLAEGARDRMTSTGFSHTIGRSQVSRDAGSSVMHPRWASHDAPDIFKPLR